ncbi:MAG: DUF4426 domain-containing protein [Pseudomonadota bacterium]
MRNAALAILLVLTALISDPLAAQQFESFGSYEVHYSAINTSQLQPRVARAYGVQRASNRALLNLAVLKSAYDDQDEPSTAQVEAEIVNLTGQRRRIEMTEIRDQGAIYYIGTFRITNEERITFRVSVQPPNRVTPYEFTFQQQFYVF